MLPTRRQALCFAAYAASRAADAGPATDLHSALDEIEAWLKLHAPHLARALRPGLTRPQMRALIGNRQVVLPEEVMVLFERWDGMADRNSFFFDRQFLSLKEALEYHDILADVDKQWGAYPFAWLPLFQVQYTRGAYAILCDPQAVSVATAPVDDVGDGGGFQQPAHSPSSFSLSPPNSAGAPTLSASSASWNWITNEASAPIVLHRPITPPARRCSLRIPPATCPW